MELFKLVGSIFVDNEAANKSISKTDEKAGSTAKTLANGAKTAAKWGAAIVGGAVAAGTAMYKMATNTASTTNEIDKMSQRLGLSRAAYQELDFVLSQSDVDINSFQTGMKTLLARMDGVTEGNKTAIENFKKLGVSVVDASGKLRTQEDVLFDTIAAFQGMENSAEKSRLAQEMFGKQGQEILPLLNAQSGSLEEMRKQAQDLGLVLGDDVIDAGVQLTDTLDQTKRSIGSVMTQLGGALIPLIQGAAEFVLSNTPTIRGMLVMLIPVITQLGNGLLPPLMDLVSSIFPLLIQLIAAILPTATQIVSVLLPVIIQLLQMLLPPIIKIVDTILPPLLELLIPIVDLLSPIINLLTPIIQLVVQLITPLTKLIISVLTPLISVVTRVITVALKPLQTALTLVAGVVTGALTEAFMSIQGIVKSVQTVFSNLISFIKNVFTGNWRAAWQNVKNIFSNIVSGIGGVFKLPLNIIIGGINGFISGLNKIKIPDWVPGVGGRTFHINPIPKLYTGAVLEKGQVGLLEGNGAEAVVPLHENRKWIHAVAEDMQTEAGIGGNDTSIKLLSAILEILENLQFLGIYIDKKTLIGKLAPGMNQELGRIQAMKART